MADEEAKAQARAKRILAAVRRRFLQRITDMNRLWGVIAGAVDSYTDAPEHPRAPQRLQSARTALIQVKERRQEVLSDYRAWMEAIYEAGYAADEEAQKVAEVEGEYNSCTQKHEENLRDTSGFFRMRDEEEKRRTEPVDPRLFKLPTLSIQEFTGDKEKFVSFKQNFDVMVGKQKLVDHQKLAHLKGCLKGKAAEAIISVGTEDADYQRAWDILEARFGDKTELVSQILDSMNSKVLPKGAGPEQQRQYCDDVTAKYNRLIEVKPDIKSHDSTIMPLITKSFSPEIKADIVKEQGKDCKVEAFLKRAQELISIEVHVRGKVPSDRGHGPPRDLPRRQGRDRGGPRGGGNHGGTGGTTAGLAATTRGQLKRYQGQGPRNPPGGGQGGPGKWAPRGGAGAPKGPGQQPHKCGMCQQNGHGLAGCPELKKLPVKARIDKVRDLKGCFKCLRTGHFSKDCQGARKCSVLIDGKECGRMTHHHLLHRAGPAKSQ